MASSNVEENNSSAPAPVEKKKGSRVNFSAARSKAKVKNIGFFGAYSVGFLFVVIFVQFIIAKVWGLENTCFKPYPNDSKLLYFDVFQYLRNFADNFRSLTLSLKSVPTGIITVTGNDVISNILGVFKTFANFFIFVFDWVLLLLKGIIFYPLYLLSSVLGFASTGFGSAISAFLTWWGTQYTS